MSWMRLSWLSFVTLLFATMWVACGSSNSSGGFTNPGSSSSGGGSSGGGGDATASSSSGGTSSGGVVGFGDGGIQETGTGSSGGGCTNIQCNIHSCGSDAADAGSTTITGQVFDPAGNNPLYNVTVYVPNSQGGKLDAIPIGVGSNSCSCDALFSGEPIAVGLTGPDGKFSIPNAPDGANIPLVVQIGKWRKEITVPNVTQCGTTDAGKITLPKNLSDGQYASLPNIAISTGGADTLECLLTRVGVDEAYFTGQTAGPGVHIFTGFGGHAASGSKSAPTALWDSQNDLMQYDILMFSCEGMPTVGVNATTASYLGPYVSAGGRVFAEHYHYAFFTSYGNPPAAYTEFPNVANWENLGAAGNDAPYSADIENVIQTTLPGGANFPEGVALKTWLGNVGALDAKGELVVPVANARVDATVSGSNVATPWTQSDSNVSPPTTQYFSWDMPFNPPKNEAGVPQYCGRVVYSDMHVSGSASDYSGGSTAVPAGCDATSKLSADEDAIEFILFDLSSCIVPVGFTPVPPPTPEGGIQ